MIGLGSGESSGSDHLQADAAAPEHGNGLPWLYPSDVPHRSHAGDHAAAEQRRLPQRKLAWISHGAPLRDRRALREARRSEPVLERRPVEEPQPAAVPSMSIPRAPCSATVSQRFGLPARQYRHDPTRGNEQKAT